MLVALGNFCICQSILVWWALARKRHWPKTQTQKWHSSAAQFTGLIPMTVEIRQCHFSSQFMCIFLTNSENRSINGRLWVSIGVYHGVLSSCQTVQLKSVKLPSVSTGRADLLWVQTCTPSRALCKTQMTANSKHKCCVNNCCTRLLKEWCKQNLPVPAQSAWICCVGII